MMGKLLAWDAKISARLRVAEKPGWLRRFAKLLAHSGDSWFWILGLIIVGWLGTPYWRWRMITFGVGVLVTAVLVMIVKFAVRRRRPEGDWGDIYRSTDPHSFPSGHAARAFLLATMAVAFGPTWFAVILVIWAPLVALARVSMGVHYFSDVFVGGLFGIFMGWIVYSVGVGALIANAL
ncbi:phosphatase PAP2 family protein [Chloroflexota bacterium]